MGWEGAGHMGDFGSATDLRQFVPLSSPVQPTLQPTQLPAALSRGNPTALHTRKWPAATCSNPCSSLPQLPITTRHQPTAGLTSNDASPCSKSRLFLRLLLQRHLFSARDDESSQPASERPPTPPLTAPRQPSTTSGRLQRLFVRGVCMCACVLVGHRIVQRSGTRGSQCADES